MNRHGPLFKVSIARTKAEIQAAQRLRYQVFVAELGGSGPMVDHAAGLECDRFDDHATHIILRDMRRTADDQVVGVYRVMTTQGAAAAGQFYCEDEYDLTPLKATGQTLLELGRSCLHPDYRRGAGLMHLWSGLADFIDENSIDILFGVASFHGIDVGKLSASLSLLHHSHLAPERLRVTAKPPGAQDMNMIAADQIDRVAATRDIPALIKAYLRLGGVVGQGAFVDHAFNTTDICLILPTDAVGSMQRRVYERGHGLG